jgi:hypothetical protein
MDDCVVLIFSDMHFFYFVVQIIMSRGVLPLEHYAISAGG